MAGLATKVATHIPSRGSSGTIKSVQYGSITLTTQTSNTATITSVNTSKTAIILLHQSSQNTAGIVDQVRLTLTNATTVTATGANADNTRVVQFCVVEFQSGAVKSLQTGTTAVTGLNTSNTSTVTSVNTAKAALFYQGQAVFESDGRSWIRLTLTNATTITADRNGSGNSGTTTSEWTLVEFN